MTVTAIRPADVSRATEVRAGLRALEEFLGQHPGLPLGIGDIPFRVFVQDDGDEENRAEIDRIAGILGVAAYFVPDSGHYMASRDFGGGIRYEATAISQAEREDWRNLMNLRRQMRTEAKAA